LRKGIHDEEIKTRGGEDLSKAKEYDETWIEAICSSVSQKRRLPAASVILGRQREIIAKFEDSGRRSECKKLRSAIGVPPCRGVE